jgi:hypothetical protein
MSDGCVTTSHTRFLDLLNGLRRRRGLPPLEVDSKLQAAANFRAGDMVARNYFSHSTPGHGTAREVVEEFGYDGDLTGENICWGEKTAEEAFDTWVTSPDHLENMVSPHYVAVGIGGPVGVQWKDQKWGLWATAFGSTLSTPVAACDDVEAATMERPDRPPRTLRLPRERPPRESRHGDRQDDDREHDRRDRDRRDRDRRERRDRPRQDRGDEQPVDVAPARPEGTQPSGTAANVGSPSGPIVTAAPWGSFGVDWEDINQWDDAIQIAAEESAVPAERIKAHIVIESGGSPDAIQKNNANGWSYGLMQVVPRWWKDLILRLAGRADSGQSEDEIGQMLLADPTLAIRSGAGVLKSFFDGDWDRTSSKFFLGNPNWVGADTVNGNSGLQYKAMLEGLIAEMQTAQEMETRFTQPASPEPRSEPEAVAEPIQFGLVPHPPFEERLIPDELNAAWDDLGQRTVKGVVLHRQQGLNWGTDAYFRAVPPGGAGACAAAQNDPRIGDWGGCRALTDYGVDHESGQILRWNDPTGAAHPGVSPNRGAWASGPYSDAFGDGLAFVQDNGGDVNVVNRDQASIEISGTFHEPILNWGEEQPISEACKESVAAMIAHYADAFQIPYHSFPFPPGKNYSFVRWHHEFTRGTGKYCPGQVVMDATQGILDRAKAIMKQHQVSAATAPQLDVRIDVLEGAADLAEVSASVAGNGAGAGHEVPAGAVPGTGAADCPRGYPIKGNASSLIYHVPDGGSYNQTIPEYCFVTAEDAEAAGFRAAKN